MSDVGINSSFSFSSLSLFDNPLGEWWNENFGCCVSLWKRYQIVHVAWPCYLWFHGSVLHCYLLLWISQPSWFYLELNGSLLCCKVSPLQFIIPLSFCDVFSWLVDILIQSNPIQSKLPQLLFKIGVVGLSTLGSLICCIKCRKNWTPLIHSSIDLSSATHELQLPGPPPPFLWYKTLVLILILPWRRCVSCFPLVLRCLVDPSLFE